MRGSDLNLCHHHSILARAVLKQVRLRLRMLNKEPTSENGRSYVCEYQQIHTPLVSTRNFRSNFIAKFQITISQSKYVLITFKPAARETVKFVPHVSCTFSSRGRFVTKKLLSSTSFVFQFSRTSVDELYVKILNKLVRFVPTRNN